MIKLDNLLKSRLGYRRCVVAINVKMIYHFEVIFFLINFFASRGLSVIF